MSHSQKLRRRSCPSVRSEELGSYWKDFEIIFLKSVEKAQASLKFDKNNGMSYVMTKAHLRKYFAEFFSGWEIFQTKCVEKIEAHI